MDYMACLSRAFPGVIAVCEGDPTVYANVTWVDGDPIPTEGQMQAAQLQLSREDKWEEIKAERERRDETSGILVNGKWFHSDLKSKLQQAALKTAADQNKIPAGLMWKTMDGSFVSMTNELANTIFVDAMILSTKIFHNAEVHRLAMLSLPDPTNYDFSNGWPQTFQEWQASQTP